MAVNHAAIALDVMDTVKSAIGGLDNVGEDVLVTAYSDRLDTLLEKWDPREVLHCFGAFAIFLLVGLGVFEDDDPRNLIQKYRNAFLASLN